MNSLLSQGKNMSNPEKSKMDIEEEINENSDESDYLWSDDVEGQIRELVLALPALSVSERDEAIRQKAAVAAELVVAAAQEAAVTMGQMEQGAGGIGETAEKKNVARPKKVKLDELVDAAGASGSKALVSAEKEEPAKKPRRKSSAKLSHLPKGPPRCNICGRCFVSWKAVFGHLRAHKDRGYLGFLPPPTFNAAEEGSGGVVAASSGGGGFALGTGGLQIDLNADPVEDEEETGRGFTPKFDLNMSPPEDEEEEKEDKAE